MKSLARLAGWVLAYTIAVILWGAVVRATGSGAGCGSHWPLCNGEVIPLEPSIKTLIEFSHRLTSGLSLLAVFYLYYRVRKEISDRRDFLRKAAFLSAIAILLEAIIGAGLVLLELVGLDESGMRAVSIILHLVNTSFLTAALVAVWEGARTRAANPTAVLQFWPKDSRESKMAKLWLGGFLWIGAAGALTALGDTLFKPESLLAGVRADFAPDAHFLERLRVFHPVFAVLWGVARIGTLMDSANSSPLHRQTALWIAVNLGLGVANILLLAPVWMQVLHLLMANLIWMGLIRVQMRS
jgi:cytochrome c oxidase assembly protein subunit 15